jgi:L-histidine Nalpha-methyltransferase
MSSRVSGPSRSDRAVARYRLDVHADDATLQAMLVEDVRSGLTARPRSLPPKYFYDATGSRLFDRITELPEYYLTRAEEALLKQVAPDVIRRSRPRDIVELGPGSCRKMRWLVDALDGARGIRYVPFDIDQSALAGAAGALARDYPRLRIHAVAGDFQRHLGCLPPRAGRRLVLFLGSTIGNFHASARRTLLTRLRRALGPDGRLLLGVDLVKSRHVLELAYNDAAGVTREFNRNILNVVNRAVDGDFRPEAYRHHAFYCAEESRIEMHLIPSAPQRVELRRLGLVLDVEAGDGIWTESSYKFTRDSAEAMLAEAGLAIDAWYTDEERWFGLVLARPAPR